MVIQYLLLLSFAGIMLALLRRRTSMRSVAGRRLLLLGVSVAGIAAVLRPSLTTEVAHAVGVGRGADLVLYLLAASSVFVWAASHLRMRAYDEQIVLLARRLAITEALVAARPAAEPSSPLPPVLVPQPRSTSDDAARVSP